MKSIVDPYNHQTRIFVDEVKLKSTLFVAFRTTGNTIYLYIDGWREGVGMINQNDIAIFITERDSVVVRSTGVQDFHDRGKGDYRHEYVLSEDGLSNLAASPIKTIVRYSTAGVTTIDIPEKNQKLLMGASADLLEEFQKSKK
ncbi:MAG: hypothetical protein JST75_08695 [Bacteroidetes bacterium]|nr:hypothetical protein [Bacteroidota bacterium]